MSTRYRLPSPILQSIGIIAASPPDRPDAPGIEHKPVAAAIVTLSQQDDGRIAIFHEIVTASDETEFPLVWLLEQELVTDVPTLIGPADGTLLLADAAAERHFVEPKLARLLTASEQRIDIAGLVGLNVDERTLCRRLRIPTIACDSAEASKIWTWYPREARVATLGQKALGIAVSRLMLWANVMATLAAEPGLFYEPMIALHGWLAERETDAPELYAWGTSKPVMRAASFVEEYRRDLGRRIAGQKSDWPTFERGLFHC